MDLISEIVGLFFICLVSLKYVSSCRVFIVSMLECQKGRCYLIRLSKSLLEALSPDFRRDPFLTFSGHFWGLLRAFYNLTRAENL